MDEDQDLCFTIEVIHAHFTTPGRYFLTLHITGTEINRSKLKLYVNNSTEPFDDLEFCTDACLEDGDPDTVATFTDSLVSFWIPSESAKGNIQLLIEAYCLPDNPMHEGEKCGEAVFDVYPRMVDLFTSVHQHETPSTQDPRQVYQFERQFVLSQVLDSERFSANCGVLTAAVTLKSEEPKPKQPLEQLTVGPRISGSRLLVMKQLEAGSLANVCPSCDSPIVANKELESDNSHNRKNRAAGDRFVEKENISALRRDSVVMKQQNAGSLANFCPSCEFAESDVSGTEPEVELGHSRWKNRREEDRIVDNGVIPVCDQRISRSQCDGNASHILKQEQAGSLANFYPSFQLSSPVSDRELHFSDELVSKSRDEGRYIAEEQHRPEKCPDAQVLHTGHFDEGVSNSKSLDGIVDQKSRTETISSLRTLERKKQEKTVLMKEDKSATVYQKEHTSYLKVSKPDVLVPFVSEPGPSSATIRTIAEPPVEPLVSTLPAQHMCGSYTARKGYCEVVVLAHGAHGLPFKSDGRPPRPYIAGKSGRDLTKMQDAKYVTHAAIQPTHSPSWEELLMIEVKEEDSDDEVIVLQVADHPSKELLTEYSIPLSHLKPFHQYHLELVQPNSELNGDIRLYITVMKKMDKLPLPAVDSKMYGMEVLLCGLESPVNNQMGPVVATGRIVADWKEYRENMLSVQPRPVGVRVSIIHFPSPHPTSFTVAGTVHVYGAPLVTVPGEPPKQPQWNQTLFFAGDESTMFTSTSALVIEYYPASLGMSGDWWQLRSPIGYSHQTLDQLLLSSLQCDSGRLGLRLDNLPIEGCQLRTAIGTSPAVNMALRLVTNQRPDQLLSAAQLSSLPAFRTGPEHNLPDQNWQQTDKTPYGLPPMDAVKNVLPQFHSLYNSPKTEPVKEYVPLANIISPPETGNSDLTRGPVGDGARQINPEIKDVLDVKSLAVLDYQMKEVDRYRTAMRKMATDLLRAREDCKRLEEDNSRLRRDLGQHDEISRLMVSSKDLDNVTHSEIVQKFVLLKKKLADESTKRQELQTRLQHLQNELIKKNDMAKEFLMLQEAHEGQQALLQRLQGKIQKAKAIQDTCRKQEKVILKLEQLLAEQGKGQFNGVSLENSETYRTLAEENVKLEAELRHLKELLHSSEEKKKEARSTDVRASNGPMSDLERLELYEKLERGEGRILALEKQIADNVRKWAKDKTDLQIKLSERIAMQSTGYKDSSTSIDILDWNGPKPVSPSRSFGPRRPSPKLDPLARR